MFFLISKFKNFVSTQALLKHSSMIFAASLFGSIALFISSILLADFFGPEEFANFKIATNLFIFLPSLIEFGIGVTFVKYIAEFSVHQKEKIPHLIVSMLKIRLISFILLLFVLLLFKEQIAEIFFHSPEYVPLVIAGLCISGFLYFEIFKQIALGFQEFKKYAFSEFLTLFISGVLSLVLGFFFGVFWAIIGWGVAYFLGNLPILFFALKKLKSTKVETFKTKTIFLSYSLPMYSTIIPNILGMALVPIISIFFPKELVGLFAFSLIFFNGAILVPRAICSVILPKVSKAKEENEETEKILISALKKYTLILIPLVVFAIVATEPILAVIAPKYLEGVIITQVLIILSLVLGYLQIFAFYLAGLGKIKTRWIIEAVRNIALLVISFGLLSLF